MSCHARGVLDHREVRVDVAPHRRTIDAVVVDAARRVEVVGPRQTEVLDVVSIDLIELAEPRFAVVEADRRPILRRAGVGLDRVTVDRLSGRVRSVRE